LRRAAPASLAAASALAIRFEGWATAVIAVAYLVLFSALSVLRHETYHSFGNDLGLFDQIFWNTTQGRPFESTISLGVAQPHSFFGDHFSPIYWVLYPVYWLFPHPDTLLLLQTLALAAGVLPIYLLARAKLEPGFQRLAWVLVYFLFVPLAYVNLYDFHEVAFAVLPLGFAAYFAERGRAAAFSLSLLAALLVKEEIALIGIGFGIFLLLGKRRVKIGLPVLLGSAAAFVVITGMIIPGFAGGHTYAYASRYEGLGKTWSEILLTLATKPAKVVTVLVQPKKLAFLAGIFGPVLGLSALAGWSAVLLLPTLGYLLLSSYPPEYSFADQYAAPLIPLVLATSILAVTRLPTPFRTRLLAAVAVSSIGFSFLFGDLPFSRKFDGRVFRSESRYSSFAPALRAIPASASVASENNLTPHISQRRYVYTIEYEGTQGADYVVLDYAATGYNLDRFCAQLQGVQLEGYNEVASGLGLSLMKRADR
jgi:uncharacterized membrane protein